LDSRSENRVDCRSWTKICAQNVSPESFPVFSAELAYIALSQKKFVGIQILKIRMQDSLGHLRPQLPPAVMTLFQKLAYCESDLPGVSGAWPLGKKQPSANEQCEQTPSYFHKTFKAIQANASFKE
jgi:hypothetical protein